MPDIPVDPAHYGELWADIYDDEHAFMDPAPAVDFLAEMAADGPALELGIGTGRIALPLAARGVSVSGIDASPAMAARLRSKPGGAQIPITIGDMAIAPLGGPFQLIYVVFNTFFGLATQERQIECVRNIARSLRPSGRLVVECFVQDLIRFRDGNQTLRVISLDQERVRMNASMHDPVNQRITVQVMFVTSSGVRLLPAVLRYAWPSEIDLMARLGGLSLESRFGGWRKEPFTAQSTSHVSVYMAPTEFTSPNLGV